MYQQQIAQSHCFVRCSRNRSVARFRALAQVCVLTIFEYLELHKQHTCRANGMVHFCARVPCWRDCLDGCHCSSSEKALCRIRKMKESRYCSPPSLPSRKTQEGISQSGSVETRLFHSLLVLECVHIRHRSNIIRWRGPWNWTSLQPIGWTRRRGLNSQSQGEAFSVWPTYFP